jgi:hypothetical protein
VAAIAVLCSASLCDRCDPDRVSEQGFTGAGLPALSPPAGRVPFDEELREACGGHGLTPEGTAALGRWPYLQDVGPDQATVMWTTRANAAEQPVTLVIHGLEGETLQRVPATRDEVTEAPSGPQFRAKATALSPGETYCYYLEADGEAWTQSIGFRTAPKRGLGTVEMVALADVGMNTPEQRTIRDQFSNYRAQAVLFAGDIAYKEGRRQEFEDHFFSVYRDYLMHVPAYPASGNHEYPTEDALPFREVFSLIDHGIEPGRERWYSFDWGPAHVVVLDSEQLGAAQRDWLEDDLRQDRERGAQPFTIAMVHRPPYASGYHGSDLPVRELFGPVFSEYGVQLVLSGHEHHYERSRPIDGVTYVISGGGGAGTRKTGKEEHAEVAIRVAHFVHLTVSPEALELVAIDAEGTPFDRAMLQPRNR